MKIAKRILTMLLILLAAVMLFGGCDECEAGHIYTTWAVLQEAGCTETGAKMSVCDECGESHMEEIPAKGHTAGKWVIAEEATVEKEGKLERYCIDCEALMESETIEKVVEEPATPQPTLPSDPSAPDTDTTPEDEYTDPSGDPDHGGGQVDQGTL